MEKNIYSQLKDIPVLSYGQKAVGITFNPGGNPLVNALKQQYADIIDKLNDQRAKAEGQEAKRMYSVAITEAQTSQKWAADAATWQY